MHIIPTIIAALAGFAAVSASPFRRTTGTVEGDIATIQSDVISLDSKIKSFSGSLLDALSFLTAYESLSSAITTTTADINASTAFSSSESAVLADQIGGLTNDIIVTLGDAVAKESIVAASGYADDVLGAIKTLGEDADALFIAIEAKIEADYAKSVAGNKSVVDKAFSEAIAAY